MTAAHLRNVLADYGGGVRIITGGDPREVTFNVMVQVYRNHDWRDERGFNSFSNDYAYSSAREFAEQLLDPDPPVEIGEASPLDCDAKEIT